MTKREIRCRSAPHPDNLAHSVKGAAVALPLVHLAAWVSSKGFMFSDRGEFVPKGFDEGVRLWDVRWQE